MINCPIFHQLVVAVVVALLLLATNGAEAVTCYECASDTYYNCGSSVGGASTCYGSTCYTFSGTVGNINNAKERSCSDSDAISDGCRQVNYVVASGTRVAGTYCFCSSSYCNSNDISSASVSRGLGPLVILTVALIGTVSRCVGY